MPASSGPEDEHPDAPRRELLYAVLALVSLLIGISRLVDQAAAPLWLKAVDAGIAGAFLLDWVRRIHEAPQRGRYALRNSYEILTFIPFTLLPMSLAGGDVIRGARLVRLLRFVRYGRFAKVGVSLARLPRRVRYLQRVVRNAQLVNILLVGLVTVSFGAAVLLVVERDALTPQGYGTALWWSLNLFMTVNYAIPPPSTSAGHLTAGALMVAGVAYIGIFTASLASSILRTTRDE